jgi:hypothetical protein
LNRMSLTPKVVRADAFISQEQHGSVRDWKVTLVPSCISVTF